VVVEDTTTACSGTNWEDQQLIAAKKVGARL
jgi:hypothetical protein